jgi:hypothetical protein
MKPGPQRQVAPSFFLEHMANRSHFGHAVALGKRHVGTMH